MFAMKAHFLIFIVLLFGCSSGNNSSNNSNSPVDYSEETTSEDDSNTTPEYKLLFLGDSYTVGQSVCGTCNFPAQLISRLENSEISGDYNKEVIAQTGWTTTNLLGAISAQNPSNDYDLVTLLIGVNNQYQHKPFSIYEEEFPELLDLAKGFAGGDPNRVIVISIPDYAYTPYGENNPDFELISQQIDQYNDFAQSIAETNNVNFLYITDITRLGLENPSLVASDGLHPSGEAYSQFVDRLMPLAIEKIP